MPGSGLSILYVSPAFFNPHKNLNDVVGKTQKVKSENLPKVK